MVNSLKLLSCTLIVVIIFSSACNSSQKPTNNIIESELGVKIDSVYTPLLLKALDDYQIPGIAIGVVKGDEIIYGKALGKIAVESEEELNLNSVFHMASISKLFVATAVIQLHEQGLLNLEDPVIKHLPYFEMADERHKEITIQEMLSHVSGMPDVSDYEWENPRYDETALEDYVKSLKDQSLINDPGTSFAYSNMAFEILGDLIAKVSGLSFEDYQAQFILEPLSMSNSSFLKSDVLPENWAAPHVRLTQNKTSLVYPYNRRHAPSSTLHSSVNDMANWMIVNLNKGELAGIRIFSEDSHNLLWTEWEQIDPDNYMGLSWFKSEFAGKTLQSHSGSDLGFTTNLVLVPEEDIGIVMMTNISDANLNALTYMLLRTIFDMEQSTGKIPAYIPVTEMYNNSGLEQAVALWNRLYQEEPNNYNFNPMTFAGLNYAMILDDPEEAAKLGLLIKEIFNEDIHNYIIYEVSSYLQSNPENEAAKKILQIYTGE